jgi:hypothetical protein
VYGGGGLMVIGVVMIQFFYEVTFYEALVYLTFLFFLETNLYLDQAKTYEVCSDQLGDPIKFKPQLRFFCLVWPENTKRTGNYTIPLSTCYVDFQNTFFCCYLGQPI